MGNATPSALLGLPGCNNGCAMHCVATDCERVDCMTRSLSKPAPEADGTADHSLGEINVNDIKGTPERQIAPGLSHQDAIAEPDWLSNYMHSKKLVIDQPQKRVPAADENATLFRHNTEESAEIKVDDWPKRPSFEVDLIREGKHWRTLGLIVSADDSPKYLIVEDIWRPSLISEWNDLHLPAQHVCVGDFITSINDVSGDSTAMLATIQSLGKGSHVKLQID